MKNYDLGIAGEETAALYLVEHGYSVVDRRVRIGRSEVDLIVENDECVVFVEVKTRRAYPELATADETPSAAIDAKKQGYLIRASEEYLLSRQGDNNLREKYFRIDVVEVFADPSADGYRVLAVNHIENAVRRNGKFSLKSSRKSQKY